MLLTHVGNIFDRTPRIRGRRRTAWGIGGLGLLLVGAVLLLGAVAPAARANELVDIAVPDRGGELPKAWVVRYPEGTGHAPRCCCPTATTRARGTRCSSC